MKKTVLLIIVCIIFGCSSDNKDIKNVFGKISDTEPNDNIKKANSIIADRPIVGFFNKNNKIFDVDFYKVSFPFKNVSYEITLSAVPGVNSSFSIFNEKGKVIYKIDENGIGESEKLWEYNPKEEFTYLNVESKSGSNEKVPYVINFITKEESPAEEIEPNNNEENATIFKLNETKKGYISPKNDVDYYKVVFDDDKPHDFNIETESLSNVDINFVLINKFDGKTKTVNNNSWGGTEIFPYICSSKGDYYIKITGKLNDDKKDPIYYLSIKELNNTSDDNKIIYYEQEFNDIPESSVELISGGEFIGSFFPENDSDWYKFDLFKKPISVDISISRVKGVDSIIEIYDSNNILLQKINNNMKDNGEQATLNNLDKGKYFIKLSSNDKSLQQYKFYFYIRYE